MSAAGLSRVRLARMHDVMADYVERGDVPGLVTLVSRRDEVHVDVIGTRAFKDPDPMRRAHHRVTDFRNGRYQEKTTREIPVIALEWPAK